MKKNAVKFLSGMLLLASLYGCKEKGEATSSNWSVASPDSSLRLSVFAEGGKVFYTVLRGADTAVGKSPLGISRADQQFNDGLSFVSVSSVKLLDEAYTMTIGKRKENKNLGNEIIISLKNKNGTPLQIAARAYNDGVAFRYQFAEGSEKVTINAEATGFAVPTEGKAWLQTYGIPNDWGPAYEQSYTHGSEIGKMAPDSSGWSFPALFQTKNNWVLITESDLGDNYFASHLQPNSDGGVYKIRLPEKGEGLGTSEITATTTLPFNTPWRTIIIGKSLGTIVESNLVHDLSASNKIGDVSWIKPGRASWNWWGEHTGSKTFSSLKNFVDLAKEMGWEYSLVDANWDIMEGGGTIADLVKYANEKQIGLLLWYNSGGAHNKVTERPRDIMSDPVKRKEEFKKLNGWGVKGVKIDFFQSDKQDIIKLYLDILKDAADAHILIDFHGCTLPRGWSRTYPNLMSMEAIKGAEQYGWDSAFAKEAPSHNTIVMCTRNVVGPMDYTPVTFSSYECCPHITTNAHELALSVLFESGLLHFADRAAPYRALNAQTKAFLKAVPVTWDDTKFIEGEPGKHMVLARQKGTDWFIAGANGENVAKELDLKMPFLKDGEKYKMMILKDGAKATEIKVEEMEYTVGSPMKVNVLGNGGFTLWLKK